MAADHAIFFCRTRRITMKMRFKQRAFTWFDSYEIKDEAGLLLYTVQGKLSWGHCLKIFDAEERELVW